MCSVLRCDSSRRSAQRFKLPEDAEKRLEWVQFVLEVNGQRLKESCWTEISICTEHFTEDCFGNTAVPVSPDPSDSSDVDYSQMVQNVDMIREKVAVLPMKRKYVVNENWLLQLFSSKCPLCGSKVRLEKVTHGILMVVNQQCLQCDYRKQWKSQVSARVPAAEVQHPTGGTIEAGSEESDPVDERGESSDQRDIDSDEDWRPTEEHFPANMLHTDSDEDAEEEQINESVFAVKHNHLCTECGKFFSQRWPHTCEHKLKPYSCNICGKRCVSEVALITHNRVHNVNWVHRCKYCHATFKTKVDKISHEQIHIPQEEPYKCPDCSETFATNKERQIHLEDHRGPKQLTCHVCGIEFNTSLSIRRHLVVHSGLKPFKCTVCDRGFNQASHLKSHMRLHTGEKPFKCQHCDKSFTHNVSLKSHVQRYHTSNAILGRKRGRTKKTVTDSIDSQEKGSKRGAELGLEEGLAEYEVVEKERIEMAIKKRSTVCALHFPKSPTAATARGSRDRTHISGMCSVLRCDSSRRSAQRFKLPEDAEKRLEWVQFVLEVNGQRLKESCWTEISICTEHFTEDCFGNTGPTGAAQLQPGAVPCGEPAVRGESDSCGNIWPRPPSPALPPQQHTASPTGSRTYPHWHFKYPNTSSSDQYESQEPVGTTEVVCDDLETCNSPTSSSTHTLTESPVSSGVSVSGSLDVSDAVTTGCGHKEQMGLNTDLNIEKAALLNIEGKYVVNERCLLQLFHRKCPSCGCELHMEKVACGALTVFDQQCRRCEYRNEWKSQVNASVPAAELVPPQPQNAMPTDDNLSSAVFSEIDTFNDEESHPSEEGAEGDEGGVSSDGEWEPTEDFSLTEALTKESEEETEDEGEDINSPVGLKINELCTDCGKLYNILKPHTCEHKIKPYACNVCGKRCVNETSLKTHSKIHNETFEIPCKYCYAPFKTKVDKVKHEQIHEDRKDPYKCPDCPQTFATSKARSVHLSNHRAPREFKCGVCEFEFKDIHHLRRHSVVHTGLKPYKCSVCQRDFNQSSHLKSHMRLHTGERPYKCRHCDKGFNHNVSLKSHVQRYHTSRSGQKKGKTSPRLHYLNGDPALRREENRDSGEQVIEKYFFAQLKEDKQESVMGPVSTPGHTWECLTGWSWSQRDNQGGLHPHIARVSEVGGESIPDPETSASVASGGRLPPEKEKLHGPLRP
ncbi:putative zinc finger protein 14-like [Scophthalmus maximus]|uniref:Putative zinc finger protein 14-like n=1 Tax=Scophthalmus maximus TaxID=52904 RepID=A0A2U9BK51_SCOMX|nr:putative zinc finger protein 14-like [Scophthalmus maximus]